MKLAKALGSVGGLTLASRVLALVRDSLAARYVGAGFASDAFNGVAFRLPNMFRALFAEGAFSAAFIPMFNRKAAGPGGVADGYQFAERALAVLLPVLVAFTALLIAAAWPITWALSGGFSRQNPTPEQFAFAVMLSRITLPYLAAGRHPEFARQILGQCRRADPAQPRHDRGTVAVPWRRRI